MWKLTITVENAKQNITRVEHFDTPEAADSRRTFLKSIEGFGSTNAYSLIAA